MGFGGLDQAEHERLFGRFLAVADRQSQVGRHLHVADGGCSEAHFRASLLWRVDFGRIKALTRNQIRFLHLEDGNLPSGINDFITMSKCPCLL